MNDQLTMFSSPDDRPKYASLQAILYGPYLLAGHSEGDWNITETAKSLSDWITPIPASYNSHLVTFSKESRKSKFVLTSSNSSFITMEKFHTFGTDTAVRATLRLIILKDSSSSERSSHRDFIGKSVMLEPFGNPGMLVVTKGKHHELVVTNSSRAFGKHHELAVTNSSRAQGSSVFRIVSGLDGKNNTVSLESKSHKGCYVYSLNSGKKMTLRCHKKSKKAKFNHAVSFVMEKGKSKYHPISFVAKGANRNYLLEPLLSFRDESYTVYFNIQA